MPYNHNDQNYHTPASRISSFGDFTEHEAQEKEQLRRMRRNFRKRGETHQAPGERKHKWDRVTHKITDLSAEEVSDRVEALGEGHGHATQNYMFFANVKNICRMAEEIMDMDPQEVDRMLANHGWATDHIATSKDDVEEVYNWLISRRTMTRKPPLIK
jgi:hypothetical protein